MTSRHGLKVERSHTERRVPGSRPCRGEFKKLFSHAQICAGRGRLSRLVDFFGIFFEQIWFCTHTDSLVILSFHYPTFFKYTFRNARRLSLQTYQFMQIVCTRVPSVSWRKTYFLHLHQFPHIAYWGECEFSSILYDTTSVSFVTIKKYKWSDAQYIFRFNSSTYVVTPCSLCGRHCCLLVLLLISVIF